MGVGEEGFSSSPYFAFMSIKEGLPKAMSVTQNNIPSEDELERKGLHHRFICFLLLWKARRAIKQESSEKVLSW